MTNSTGNFNVKETPRGLKRRPGDCVVAPTHNLGQFLRVLLLLRPMDLPNKGEIYDRVVDIYNFQQFLKKMKIIVEPEKLEIEKRFPEMCKKHNLPQFLCDYCFKKTGLEESLTMGSLLPRDCMVCGETVSKGDGYNFVWKSTLEQFYKDVLGLEKAKKDLEMLEALVLSSNMKPTNWMGQ